MRISTFFICIVLFVNTACGAATWAFRGIQGQEVEIEDHSYVVRIKEGWAEAVRITPQALPNTGRVFAQASRAMEQVSGCTVVAGSLRGDPAVVRAQISCD